MPIPPPLFSRLALPRRARVSLAVLACVIGALSGDAQVEQWRNDRMTAVLPTLQAAVDAAQPGDVLRLRAGVYHENVRITNKRADADRPFVIEPVAGAEVIIDGADPELQRAGNGRWTALPDGVGWQATVPWAGRESRALLTWASHADEKLIAAHHDEAFFRAGSRGDALWRTGERVWLRLADGRDPNEVPLNIGRAEGVLQFEDSRGWVVRGLVIKHAGFAGIHLNGAGVTDVVIENVTVRTAFRGISTEERKNASSRITIRDSRVLNHWDFNWEWRNGYRDTGSGSSSEEAAPMRGTGIRLMAEDSEIVGCEVGGQWDGMMVQGRRVRVHRNIIHHTNDDMIELESGGSADIWFHDNVGFHLFSGISIVSNQPGPVYIYRNRIQSITSIRYEGEVRRFGYPLKFGHDWGPNASNIHIYQNTFDSEGRTAFVQSKSGFARWRDIHFINNLCHRRNERGPVGFEGMGSAANGIVWEGNLFTSERALARLAELDPAFATAGVVAGVELGGADAAPPLFTVSEDGAARAAGSAYALTQGWPDSRPRPSDGVRPDIGAVPAGDSPRPAGPGGSLYLPWSKKSTEP